MTPTSEYLTQEEMDRLERESNSGEAWVNNLITERNTLQDELATARRGHALWRAALIAELDAANKKIEELYKALAHAYSAHWQVAIWSGCLECGRIHDLLESKPWP
jgi:hypothetical protein